MIAPCAVSGCTHPAARGQVMCSDHWLLVPKAERVQVTRTWRALDRALQEDRAETFESLRAYQEAVESAQAAVGRALAPVADGEAPVHSDGNPK